MSVAEKLYGERYGELPDPCYISYIGVFAGSRRPQPIFQRRQASLVDDSEGTAVPKPKPSPEEMRKMAQLLRSANTSLGQVGGILID